MVKVNQEKQALKTLIWRNLKAERGRNTVTIFAVMITTILFTAVISLFFSVQKTQKYTDQLQFGDCADAQIKLLSKEETEKVRHLPVVKEIGIIQDVGYVSNMKKHHSAMLVFADTSAQKMIFTSVSKGRQPEKANEIAASKQALDALGWDGVLGSNVDIGYINASGTEKIFSMSVTGIWEQMNLYDYILVSKAFAEKEAPETNLGIKDSYTAYIMMKEGKSSQEEARARLAKELSKISLNTDDFEDPSFAKISLSDVNISQEDGSEARQKRLLVVVMGVLFFLCGYLLIYNVFDISIQKDIRYYGLLNTVGVEKKQILNIIFSQTFVLGGIGILVGSFIGVLVSNSLLPAILKGVSIGNEYQKNIVQHASIYYVVLLSAFLSLCTLVISVFRPALYAARTTAIEAAGFTERKVIRKMKHAQKSGPVTYLAFCQLMQNPRRTLFILVSIILSMIFVDAGFTMSNQRFRF